MIPEEVNGYKISFDSGFVNFKNDKESKYLRGSKSYIGNLLIYQRQKQSTSERKELEDSLDIPTLESIWLELDKYEQLNK